MSIDEKYTYLCKVTYWNECEEKEQDMHHLLRASNFTEAVEMLEEYHADTITSLQVECFEDCWGRIPEDAIEAVRHFYREEP